MEVSKHHYARALAERGWRVIFVDPPTNLGGAGRIEFKPTGVHGLTSLRYQTFFPYKIKFHIRPLFDVLMRIQARLLVRATGTPDLVWDFDNAYQFRDLTAFGAGSSLFHLVDDVGEPGLGIKRADHVFYLHRSFCERAGGRPTQTCEVGHGLGRDHALAAAQCGSWIRRPGPPRLGFVGNLAAAWIDWGSIAEVLRRHPQAQLVLWGPLPERERAEPELQQLLKNPSIQFRGLTAPVRILEESEDVDLWLAPFRTDRLPSGATNSHKILEYLATGRAVAMTALEAYAGNELVAMPSGSFRSLPDLVDTLLADPDGLNPPALVARRRAYALEFTYERQLDRVLFIAGFATAETPKAAA